MRAHILAVAGLCAACAGRPLKPLDLDHPPTGLDELRSLVGAFEASAPGEVLVGVTSTHVAGWGAGPRWRRQLSLNAAPQVLPHAVVGTVDDAIVALDPTDGALLWRVPTSGAELLGAGGAHDVTAVTIARNEARELLLVGRAGELLLRRATRIDIGAPEVVAQHILLPWGGRHLSALRADGTEVGRWTVPIEVHRMAAIGGALYVGQTELVAVTPGSVGTAPSPWSPPDLPLLGPLRWNAPTELVVQPRGWARPDVPKAVVCHGNVLLGIGDHAGALSWVSVLADDVVGGALGPRELLVCTDTGAIVRVATQSGARTAAGRLQDPPRVCFGRAESNSSSDDVEASAPDPVDEIRRALEVRNPVVRPAQGYILRALGSMESPEATQILIESTRNPLLPPDLARLAAQSLAQRRNGVHHMLAALEQHYDYLADNRRPPPVGALADALLALGEARAAALLANHLNDPANPDDDVRRAARALERLATPAELPALETFFALHRATAGSDALVQAVVFAGRTMLRVGTEATRAEVHRAAADPLTHPEVRRGLAEPSMPQSSTRTLGPGFGGAASSSLR